MDMDTILNSVNGQVENSADVEVKETEAKSDNVEVANTETAESTTPVESVEKKQDEVKTEKKVETSGAPEASAEVKASEPEQKRERKVFSRSNNPLKQAQYSAAKWQKKYKRLQEEYAKTLADYEKYKDLDIAKFENDEDKQQYLAWKASRQQRLTDMQEDLGAIKSEYQTEQQERMADYDRQVYDEKVSAIYGNRADEFEALDEQWNDIYETACAQYDKHNVIKDFIRNSPVGPAIKNVIYNNGELQSDLFENMSGNDMIDASNRLRILKGLEKNIVNYLHGNTNKTKEMPKQEVASAPVKKRSLPHLPPRKVEKSSEVSAPNVTGDLTHTDKGSTPDTTTEVSNLFRSVFGG